MKPNDYTVLATSQEGQDTVPDTSGNGRPIGSNGRGYTVLAEGGDVDNYQGEPKEQDQIGLADVLMDTFHMAGSTNQDGSTDFFGGSDANERLGAGIQEASGFSGRIKPEYRSEDSEPDTNGGRVRQAIGETSKGISDLIVSGAIGAQDTIADLINLIDSDNSVADGIRMANRDMSKKQYNPGGAADAVGQEAGAMAIAAPIGGKATDLVLGSGKMVGKVYQKAVSNREAAFYAKQGQGPINVPKTIGVSLVTEILGKLSPTASKVVDKYWTKIIAPVSRRAAIKDRAALDSELIAAGMTPAQRSAIFDELDNYVGKTAVDSLIKSPNKAGSAVGALMGGQ